MRLKRIKTAKQAVASALAMGVLAISTQQACAATITEVTWNDALNGNVTSTSGNAVTNADVDIDRESTLVSFKVGADMYSNFVLASTTNAAGASGLTPYWGINAPNLTAGDDQLSVTDNRLDTGIVNLSDTAADFGFALSPTSLDQVVFLFDVGSDDGPIDVALIDGLGGSVVGSSVNVNSTVAGVAGIDFERVNGAETTGTSNVAVKGLALSFSADFGLTEGQLSSVTGVRITNGAGFDPALVGFTVPEPSSLALLGLAGMLLARRRRSSIHRPIHSLHTD